ncbi:MAG: glutathione peroxidase [Chitinophagaceae bacterium]
MLNLLKKISLVVFMLLLTFFGYVMIVNRNSVNMTGRQKVLKALYPAIVWFNKVSGKKRDVITHAATTPPVSFYSLKAVLNNGSTLDMASLKGKKVLLVNTASECGYTGQYEQLQTLYTQKNNDLVILGFPANDFKEQEKGSNEEIASFCKKNYGVTFPLIEKTVVIKSADQNNVFQWLTDPAKNGWNSQAPTWNFCKYLVDEKGELIGFYASGVEPTGKEMAAALNQ